MNEKYAAEGGLTPVPLSLEGLEYARRTGGIYEGRALLCDARMALHIDCGETEGILPREEALLTPDGGEAKDIAILSRVGKEVCFKVTGFTVGEDGKKRALLSRKAAQRECFANRISRLSVGDVIDARVTHLEHFGAFCDVGCGIVALIPIDCISVSRIPHPSERFSVGQKILAVVSGLEPNGETIRVSLSHRELLGTWEENASSFSVGQTVAGIVRSVEPYGIFIELTPNLAGLAEYRTGVSVGDTAAVYIKNILPEKMKFKLVIVDIGREETKPRPLFYRLPDSCRHLSRWVYSPPESTRVISKEF